MPEALPSSTAAGPEPRRLEASRGVDWWREAWALFTKSPGMWVLFGLVILAIDMVLSFIPLIGALASSLLMPGFIASCMVAARKLDHGGKLALADLLIAFQVKLQPMLILGALFIGVSALVMLVFAGGPGLSLIAASTLPSSNAASAMAGIGGLSLLLTVVVSFVFATMMWFATALVMFDDMEPIAALKSSWTASLKNVAPFLVYGLIGVAAAVVASILLGLGWIVLIPVSFLTSYTSYKDVFAAP